MISVLLMSDVVMVLEMVIIVFIEILMLFMVIISVMLSDMSISGVVWLRMLIRLLYRCLL